MGSRILRALGALIGAFAFASLLPPAPAGASSGDLPPDFNAELAQQFEAELVAILSDGGVDIDPAGLDDLIGEPGDFDAAPGEPVLLAAAADAVSLALGDIGGGGSQLTGPCMGLTMSFDDDGNVIDMAADFDAAAPPIDLLEYYESGGTSVKRAFTADNPYSVHVNGFVVYAGIAGDAGNGPRNHTWEITTFGQALDEGGDDNPDGENRNAGGISLKDQLPTAAKVNALFRISADMTAEAGFACAGSGFFETTGGAPIAQVAGGVLVLLGGLGAFFNARPARTWNG